MRGFWVMKVETVMFKWRRWPFYTLTSKVEPSRRIHDLSKDEKVSRKITFGSKDPYLARKIQIFERSGSKDTRYFWNPWRISFDHIHLSTRSDQLERSIWSNPSLTKSSFDWDDWLSLTFLTIWSFEGHCFLEGSDFHQHFGFWEFAIETLQILKSFQKRPFWKIARYEVLQKSVLWSISACQVSDRAPTSVNQK